MSKKQAKKTNSISPSVIIAIVVACLAVIGIVVAIIMNGATAKKNAESSVESSETASEESVSYEETSYTINEDYDYVQITMEDGGVIVVELYPDVAPITVSNFLKLVHENFYDGLIFHRVIDGFMIQGGDPTGTGYSGSDETIKGEFSSNGVENNLSHVRGVISMARSSDMDSASSQFFICQADATYLDGNYAAFGKVVSGMDVVDAIAKVQTDSNDKPISDVTMKSVTVIYERNS